MTLRVALGGIHIESSNFTPYRSGDSDFTVLRGSALLDAYRFIDTDAAAEAGNASGAKVPVHWIPLTHARALPGGIVSKDFYSAWKTEFFELLHAALAAGPIDGFFLDIHGAMSVEGSSDPEGELATELRAALGPETVISAAMDLHGNVSDELFHAVDMLTCYRTAPHIDAPQTRHRAAENLLKHLRKPRPLYRAKVDVPILLPGEKTSTEVQPGKQLYGLIPAITEEPGVQDASIWMGFPWADQPRCHGAVVTFGYDRAEVEAAAQQLGNAFWGYAEQFDFVGPTDSTEQAVMAALKSDQAPFFLSDTGDNPGAGGTGNSTALLGALYAAHQHTEAGAAHPKTVLFASVFDPVAVSVCQEAGAGAAVTVEIGDYPESNPAAPLAFKGTVKHLFADPRGGCGAVVENAGFQIILNEKRLQYSSQEIFARAGYPDFNDLDVVVVKMGYLEPDLSAAQNGWVMALTPGAVDQDLNRLPYTKVQRPLYPLDRPGQANFILPLRLVTAQTEISGHTL